MIRGVKIVSIPVRNQDVALKFYTEKIGFKVATALRARSTLD